MTWTTRLGCAALAGAALACIDGFAPRGATLTLNLPDSALVGIPAAVRATLREESGDLVPDETRVLFVASVNGGFAESVGEPDCDSPRPTPGADRRSAGGVAEVFVCAAAPGYVRISAESGPARATDSIRVVAP